MLSNPCQLHFTAVWSAMFYELDENELAPSILKNGEWEADNLTFNDYRDVLWPTCDGVWEIWYMYTLTLAREEADI